MILYSYDKFLKDNNLYGKYLFFSRKNPDEHLTIRSIQRIINDLYERASIKNDLLVVHSLRHTYASYLLAGGSDLATVKELLGHGSVITTGNTYAHIISLKRKKAAVADINYGKEISEIINEKIR